MYVHTIITNQPTIHLSIHPANQPYLFNAREYTHTITIYLGTQKRKTNLKKKKKNEKNRRKKQMKIILKLKITNEIILK